MAVVSIGPPRLVKRAQNHSGINAVGTLFAKAEAGGRPPIGGQQQAPGRETARQEYCFDSSTFSFGLTTADESLHLCLLAKGSAR